MVVKTFRGLLADGGEDRIRLSTNQGKVGYRISKFQVIGTDPGSTENFQCVVQMWKTTQSSPGTTINFTDTDLLAVGVYNFGATGSAPGMVITIFDQEIFNQDVFISQSTRGGSLGCNYYFELEVLTLSDDEAQAAILKSIRTG